MIFDLFNLDCTKLQKWIESVLNINMPAEHIQQSINLIIIIIIIIVLFLLKYSKISHLWIKKTWRANNKWRKNYIKNNLNNTYIEYKNNRLNNKYISTRMQNEAPSIYEEPKMSNANSISNNFIEHFLNNIFIENNKERLYCILADSGMGKTTALVNLFISYINKYKESTVPFHIRLLTFTDNNVISNIKAIDKQQTTILLLDALDENIEAVVNHKLFLSKIEDACKDFRFVVISCRTQFFPSEEEQIKESKIAIDGSKKGYASYNTFYLSPFNDSEIDMYINKEFGKKSLFTLNKKKTARRKKADSIVANNGCRNLLVRPMILSHIKQLANDDREYKMTIDIYDAMVDYWLDREVGRIERERRHKQKELLHKLSSELAKDIYEKRVERKGYYINCDELKKFLSDRNIDNSTLYFRERSLLNRDANGLVKFSHKSFLEYFLAKLYFDNIHSIIDFSGIEFAQDLYYELCAKYFNQNASSKKNDISISIPTNLFEKENAQKSLLQKYPSFPHILTSTTIIIERLESFNIRYLEFCNANKLTISNSINLNIFNEEYAWMSNIIALELNIKPNTNFNNIRNFKNISYLLINGDPGISKDKLIRQVLKINKNITLTLNSTRLITNGVCLFPSGKNQDKYQFIQEDRYTKIKFEIQYNSKLVKRFQINNELIKFFEENYDEKLLNNNIYKSYSKIKNSK